jgi:mannose/fructose/N-acetylgalactosamine-specific phosphotransferase system component IID
MGLLTFLFYFLVIYAVVLFFSGFAKVQFMIKLVKMKFGADIGDKKAIKIMHISAAGLLAAAVVVGLFVFGVF